MAKVKKNKFASTQSKATGLDNTVKWLSVAKIKLAATYSKLL